MALGCVRVHLTKLQMQQADGSWYEWEGAVKAGEPAYAAGTVYVKTNDLIYFDSVGQCRYLGAADGGLTAESAGSLRGATVPTSGVKFFRWIDSSLHSRAPHTDTAHVNHDDDIVHVDIAHVDTAHSNIAHSDVAHTNVPYSDSHTDDHGDTAHSDTHGDTHADHNDVGHADAHGDYHGDVVYVDTHNDIAHSDTAHSDVTHVDVAHADIAHVDTHTDTPGYDDHGDTPHVDLPSLAP